MQNLTAEQLQAIQNALDITLRSLENVNSLIRRNRSILRGQSVQPPDDPYAPPREPPPTDMIIPRNVG
jgi:hypothetical protein